MYILGLNLIHDTSAALIENGKIIAAVEEERFNRQKHTTSFPKKSIDYCLNYAGIELSDVDYIVTSFDFEKFKDNPNPFEYNTICHDDATPKGRKKILADNDLLYQRIKRELEKNGIGQWLGVSHHLAHAAGAYYLSGFKKSNIIVIDGRGENEATSLMYGNGGKIEIVDQYLINDSLGHLYTYITYLCGLYSNIGQEGKTMSLAAYGRQNSEIAGTFNKILTFERDRYRINRDVMRQLIKYKTPSGQLNDVSKDMAYAVQKNYEKVLIFLARKLKDKTGCDVYSLGGGVCLNSAGNGKLLSQNFVKEMYIQPAANDAGTALGAALYWYSQLKNLKPSKQEDVYLGPSFTNEEIEYVLKQCKIRYEKITNICEVTSEMLSQGKIIGWFQGRMEFGPRALGNRSILADPRKMEMKDKVNHHVKHREMWRPFAPSILPEAMEEYFGMEYSAPHMTISFTTKPDKVSNIGATIHIDATARIQTVDENRNKRFYQLIKNFYEITGIPAILNTSFNTREEPIVCTPTDALRCFFSTGIDTLVIDDYLVEKII